MMLGVVGKVFMRDKAESTAFIFFILAALAVYFGFGFNHIGKFEVADEHYWISEQEAGRTFVYWDSIRQGRWSDTYVNDKPGITVAIITGPALLLDDSSQHKLIVEEGYLRQYDPAVSRYIFPLYRIPILVFNGLFSLFFLWALAKIAKDRWLALWGWMLILLSPVLVGISQIVNPDSLLWSFVFAALLAYLLVLETGEKKYVALAAVMFGFAMLTKYTALVLIPFFLAMSLLHRWWNFSEDRAEFRHRIFFSHVSILIILIGGLAEFALLLPAALFRGDVWRNEIGMLQSAGLESLLLAGLFLIPLADGLLFRSRLFQWLFLKTQKIKEYFLLVLCALALALVLAVAINWAFDRAVIFPKIGGISYDLERDVKFWSRDYFEKIVLELRLIVFTVTPLVLAGWLLALVQGSLDRKSAHRFLSLYAIFFLAIFVAAVVQEKLLITARYGIVLYPVVALLGAIGLAGIAKRIPLGKYLVTGTVLAVSSVSLWLISPFYFNYTSSLLSDNRLMATAWGYGGYEAAEYLNALPGAENKTAWSDYRGFCAFFKGKCLRNDDRIGEFPVDYFIKTRRGTIVFDKWEEILESYVDSREPVWRMTIDGREKNYIEIYAGRDAADQKRVFERPKTTGELDDFGKPIKIKYAD